MGSGTGNRKKHGGSVGRKYNDSRPRERLAAGVSGRGRARERDDDDDDGDGDGDGDDYHCHGRPTRPTGDSGPTRSLPRGPPTLARVLGATGPRASIYHSPFFDSSGPWSRKRIMPSWCIRSQALNF
jgi:hypothetical protein